MIRKFGWHILISVLLVGISTLLYFAQIVIFHKPEDTFFYLFQDLAFVPIQVWLVSLLIARLLSEREKKVLLKKLNMLVGAFYSEMGNELVRHISFFNPNIAETRSNLTVGTSWSRKEFSGARAYLSKYSPGLNSRMNDLPALKTFLGRKRDFLLGLLANPNLLEHDRFTDLLWSVLHLSEELGARSSLEGLPPSDYEHLSGDLNRAYLQLLTQWVTYMEHLKEAYPYLFSLAVRMNPLEEHASPIVK